LPWDFRKISRRVTGRSIVIFVDMCINILFSFVIKTKKFRELYLDIRLIIAGLWVPLRESGEGWIIKDTVIWLRKHVILF
jgi:hypothetical protein